MNYYVYLIHNIKNNKVYIGKTNDVNRRWTEHCSVANSTNKAIKYPINYAISKYGIDNFVVSTVQNFDSEILCLEAEKYWILFYNSRQPKYGYNITDGGAGVSGWRASKATKKKMSLAQTGKIRSIQHRINIGKGRLGYHHSASTLVKLSCGNSPNAKITQNIVNKIRKLYLTGNYSHRKLAEMFNISKTQITNILNNKQWK